MNHGSIFDNFAETFRTKIRSETKKEIESNEVVLSNLTLEKESCIKDLKLADKELTSVMADLAKFVNKSKDREAELRNHIYNLSEKLRIKDIDKIKYAMTGLQSQIIENISDIDLLKREEISKKKTDIDDRINLRILDSEFRFKNVLSKKLDEQDSILRSLGEYTREMEKIKDNYENLKKKSENISRENNALKKKIKEIELKNAKVKIELTNLKKYFNHIGIKIQNNRTLDNSNLQSFNQSRKKSHTLELKQNNRLSSNLNTLSIQPDLTMIKSLLQDEKFVQNNNRSCGIISSLANILDNLKIRTSKLKLETDRSSKMNLLQEKIINLIKPSKIKTLNKSLHLLPKKNPYMGTILFKNEVEMNKDLRVDFINLLANDSDIINMVHGEKIADTLSFKNRLMMN